MDVLVLVTSICNFQEDMLANMALLLLIPVLERHLRVSPDGQSNSISCPLRLTFIPDVSEPYESEKRHNSHLRHSLHVWQKKQSSWNCVRTRFNIHLCILMLNHIYRYLENRKWRAFAFTLKGGKNIPENWKRRNTWIIGCGTIITPRKREGPGPRQL